MADTVFDDEPAFELDTNTVEQRLRLGNTHSQLRLPCLSMKDVGLYECVAQSPYEKIVTGMNLRIGKHKSSALQRLTAVSAYSTSKQLLLFAFYPNTSNYVILKSKFVFIIFM